MKTIHTLVEDIYSVFTQGADVDDTLVEELGLAIANTIKERLEEYKEPHVPRLRLSNVGKKDRQLYYELNGYKKPELSAPTKIKFLYGDILEHILLFLAKVSGHTVTGEQTKLSVCGVEGSRDCVIDGVTVDVKSASPYGFKKFNEGTLLNDDPFGYIPQITSYMTGDKETNQDFAAFLAVNKVSGELCLTEIDELMMPDMEKRIPHIKTVIKSSTPPPRCYDEVPEGKSGNMTLSRGCSYCDFKEECWKDSNDGQGLRKFVYSNGIKYLTKVVKEPKVKEL